MQQPRTSLNTVIDSPSSANAHALAIRAEGSHYQLQILRAELSKDRVLDGIRYAAEQRRSANRMYKSQLARTFPQVPAPEQSIQYLIELGWERNGQIVYELTVTVDAGSGFLLNFDASARLFDWLKL
jgi:hypothetical protein